jgi:hypothetical protein
MPIHIRFPYPSGNHLGYSVERLSDGLFYDFGDSTFKATPARPTAPLPEDTGIFVGRYKANLDPTPASIFTDGDYAVTVHHTAEGNVVVDQLGATMHDGDDATYFPPKFPSAFTITAAPKTIP